GQERHLHEAFDASRVRRDRERADVRTEHGDVLRGRERLPDQAGKRRQSSLSSAYSTIRAQMVESKAADAAIRANGRWKMTSLLPISVRRLAPRRGCSDRKCYARTLQSVSEPATNKLRRRCSSGIPDLEEPGDVLRVEGMSDPAHEMMEHRLQPRVDR